MNDLAGLSVDQRKCGAKNCVAANDFVEAPLQRWNIKAAANTKANRNVPSRIAAFELIQKPERLLGNGRRETVLVFAESTNGFKQWCGNPRWIVFCFHSYIERVVAGCMRYCSRGARLISDSLGADPPSASTAAVIAATVCKRSTCCGDSAMPARPARAII